MKKSFLFYSVFLISSLCAKTLSLNEAIDKTLHNHPDIKTFILKISQSQQSYKSERSALLPQISLQANYNPIQTYALPVNGQFHTVDKDSWGVGVGVKEKLWDFSSTDSKIKAAKLDKEIATLSLQEAKALLAYRVKSLYKLMLVQKAALKVQKEDLKRKKAYYKQAQALYKQGLKTKADKSRFLAEVYTAKDNLAITQATYQKAKTTLSLYIAETIDTNTTLQSDILYKTPLQKTKNNIKNILEENPQLHIDKLSIEKNRLLHEAAHNAHYGSIDAIASLTHLDTLNSYDSKLVGISFNMPLYAGGKLSAQAQKAKIATQISKELEASKQIKLKEEIKSLLIDITRYQQTISAKKAQLAAAKESAKVLEARYKEGMSTYIQLLDGAMQELNSRLAIIQAYYTRSLAYDRILYLEGKIK